MIIKRVPELFFLSNFRVAECTPGLWDFLLEGFVSKATERAERVFSVSAICFISYLISALSAEDYTSEA